MKSYKNGNHVIKNIVGCSQHLGIVDVVLIVENQLHQMRHIFVELRILQMSQVRVVNPGFIIFKLKSYHLL